MRSRVPSSVSVGSPNPCRPHRLPRPAVLQLRSGQRTAVALPGRCPTTTRPPRRYPPAGAAGTMAPWTPWLRDETPTLVCPRRGSLRRQHDPPAGHGGHPPGDDAARPGSARKILRGSFAQGQRSWYFRPLTSDSCSASGRWPARRATRPPPPASWLREGRFVRGRRPTGARRRERGRGCKRA